MGRSEGDHGRLTNEGHEGWTMCDQANGRNEPVLGRVVIRLPDTNLNRHVKQPEGKGEVCLRSTLSVPGEKAKKQRKKRSLEGPILGYGEGCLVAKSRHSREWGQ